MHSLPKHILRQTRLTQRVKESDLERDELDNIHAAQAMSQSRTRLSRSSLTHLNHFFLTNTTMPSAASTNSFVSEPDGQCCNGYRCKDHKVVSNCSQSGQRTNSRTARLQQGRILWPTMRLCRCTKQGQPSLTPNGPR